MWRQVWKQLKIGWKAWTRIARIIGNFQARVILTIIYATVVLPFGLAVRLFSDPLRIKKPPENWIGHPEEAQDMSWARRQ
jgi:hypothetical protein